MLPPVSPAEELVPANSSSARALIALPRPKPLGPADRNPYLVYLASLANGGSRATMASSLKIVARELGYASPEACPWASLRYQHTQALRARLAEHLSPATAKRYVSAIRGVLREAYRLGQIADADYHRAIDLPRIKGSRVPKGRGLTQGELVALFRSCDMSTVPGRRDAALLALLYGGGLRRAEVVSLRVEDYDASGDGPLVVRGKGNKERTIYLPSGARRSVDAWLEFRGTDPGPLVLPLAGRREAIAEPWRALCPEGVREALRRIAKRAGVSRFSPHDLRRSFVGDLLDAGADLATVQQMAGHADCSTTARYDRRGERSKKKASDLLSVPFVGEEKP